MCNANLILSPGIQRSCLRSPSERCIPAAVVLSSEFAPGRYPPARVLTGVVISAVLVLIDSGIAFGQTPCLTVEAAPPPPGFSGLPGLLSKCQAEDPGMVALICVSESEYPIETYWRLEREMPNGGWQEVDTEIDLCENGDDHCYLLDYSLLATDPSLGTGHYRLRIEYHLYCSCFCIEEEEECLERDWRCDNCYPGVCPVPPTPFNFLMYSCVWEYDFWIVEPKIEIEFDDYQCAGEVHPCNSDPTSAGLPSQPHSCLNQMVRVRGYADPIESGAWMTLWHRPTDGDDWVYYAGGSAETTALFRCEEFNRFDACIGHVLGLREEWKATVLVNNEHCFTEETVSYERVGANVEIDLIGECDEESEPWEAVCFYRPGEIECSSVPTYVQFWARALLGGAATLSSSGDFELCDPITHEIIQERSWPLTDCIFPPPELVFSLWKGFDINFNSPGLHQVTLTVESDSGASCQDVASIVAVGIDLAVEGLPEEQEEDPGKFMCLNSDDDNENAIPDMNEWPLDPPVSDDDLVAVTIRAGGQPGDSVTLTLPEYLEAWEDRYKTQRFFDRYWLMSEYELVVTFYVEGVGTTPTPDFIEAEMTAQNPPPGCVLEDRALVTVHGVWDMTFNPPFLPTDGTSVSQASVSFFPSPPEGQITWSIVGDTLGAHINAQTGEITAGDRDGWLTIGATLDSEGAVCRLEGELLLGCGSCGGTGCSFGGSQSELKGDGVGTRFNMGRMSDGDPAGELWIRKGIPNAYMYEPLSLRTFLHPDVPPPNQTSGGGTQIRVPQGLAWLKVTGTDSCSIEYYKNDDIAGFSGGEYVLEPGATAMVTWSISNPDPLPLGRLRIERAVGTFVRYEYEAIDNGATRVLQLTTSDLSGAVRVETETWSNNDTQRLYEDFVDNGVVYSAQETYSDFINGGSAVTQRIVDPGDAELTTEFGYVLNSGRLRYVWNQSDGSWVWYGYDASGNVNKAVYPWGDTVFADPPSNEALCRVVTYGYLPHDARDAGTVRPRSPRTIEETVLGTLVSRTYYAYFREQSPSDALVEIEERCVDVVAGTYGDPLNLRTQATYVSGDDDTIQEVILPDGRVDQYLYDDDGMTYIFDDEQTAPPWAAPTYDLSGVDDYHYTEVAHLVGGSPVDGKSTKEVVIADAAGNHLMEETLVASGGGFVRVSWTARAFDGRGRLIKAFGSDGTLSETTWECCNQSATVDAAGVRTEYDSDALGRLRESRKKAGGPLVGDIVTTYDYTTGGAGAGFRRIETVTVTGGTESTRSQRKFDRAGRLRETLQGPVSQELVTAYSYDLDDSNRSRVTVTNPDGGTQQTVRHFDGRTRSVSGTAVVARASKYELESGKVTTTVLTGTADPGAPDWPRWAKSTSDALGRALTEERPGWIATGSNPTVKTSYTYYDPGENGAGQVHWVQAEIEGGQEFAPTVYEYDTLGNVVQTGLDLSDPPNYELDETSTDRISETDTSYVLRGGEWWLQTTSKVYPYAGIGAARITGYQRQRLTGLGAGTPPVTSESEIQNIHGKITKTITTIDRGTKTVTTTTDNPELLNDAVAVTTNGLADSNTTVTGLEQRYSYDGLGRRTQVEQRYDRPGGAWRTVSTTGYDAYGRVDWVRDGETNETTYGYYPFSDPDHPGRLEYVQNALSKKTRYDYNLRGQVRHIWGDAPQPAEIEYDATYGQRVKLHTFRSGSDWEQTTWAQVNPGPADITHWTHDLATGLLNTKTYADANAVNYEYAADGRLNKRIWARLGTGGLNVETIYAYDTSSRELTGISYANEPPSVSTPTVGFTYTRLGRLDTVTDGLGTRTFVYNTQLQQWKQQISGSLYTKQITRIRYIEVPGSGDDEEADEIVTEDRLRELQIGTTADPDADYLAVYDYDDTTARMTQVAGPGLPSGGAWYDYLEDTSLVDRIDYKQGAAVQGSVIRTFEDNRDLLLSVENEWNGRSNPVSKYSYLSDELGRRTSVVRTGDEFSDHLDLWHYNDRNELGRSDRYNSTEPLEPTNPDDTLDFAYTYDPIGNRTDSLAGNDPNDTVYYCANELNQYDALDTDGNCEAPFSETFQHDEDGNLKADGSYTYEWDAENRLVRIWLVDPVPGTPQEGDRKLEFAYDFMGRRIQKLHKLYTTGAWTTQLDRRFVWDGWLMVLEMENAANTIVRKYTWGKDLSGSRGGAGGIGGLLAMQDTLLTKSYAVFYDANGNVSELIDTSDGSTAAHYEYDPYGGRMNAAPPGEYDNAIRFSTKYFDGETDLGYWGYRYYSPRLGRWLNRDLLAERDNANLYAFLHNSPPDLVDSLGLHTSAPTSKPCKLCCCCLKTIKITNIIKLTRVSIPIPGQPGQFATQYGHSFDIVITLKYVVASDASRAGDCTLKWKEKFNQRPGGYPPAAKVNQWNDIAALLPGAPTVDPWFRGRTKPCPGEEEVRITDRAMSAFDPTSGASLGKRTIYFAIGVRSTPQCPCAKSGYVFATQILDDNGEKITVQEFKPKVKASELVGALP